MSDGIEYLKSDELRSHVQSQGDAAQLYRTASHGALARVESVVASVSSCAHACASALRGIEEEIVTLSDRIRPRSFGFVDRASVYPFVCRFLMRLEERKAEAEKAIFEMVAIEEDLYGAKESLLMVQAIASVAGQIEDWRDAEAQLTEAELTLTSFCRHASALLSETLSRFAERLHVDADLRHKGENCDATAVLRLCDDLLRMIRQIGYHDLA